MRLLPSINIIGKNFGNYSRGKIVFYKKRRKRFMRCSMRKGVLVGSILVLAFVRSLSFGQELQLSVTPFKGNTARTRVFVPNEDKIGPIYLQAKHINFVMEAGGHSFDLITEKATLVFERFKENYTITRTKFGDYKFPDETNPPFIEYVAGSGGSSINDKESIDAKVVKVIVTSDGGILRGRNQRIELKAANNIEFPVTASQSKRTVMVNGTMKKN